ncbi:hypothetical protein [Nonomuraea dietziae]|uniref:Uncharacterized protein n=1 Tax=Nonomuraea dietziae TaxID=65515 RepID=A0A7W5V8X7_9ACTN|nr:hypothetical protein [Nonomuraea dietziae]MBB3731504.1 hypothetical protein [Nonomuraea dietziae]
MKVAHGSGSGRCARGSTGRALVLPGVRAVEGLRAVGAVACPWSPAVLRGEGAVRYGGAGTGLTHPLPRA